MNDTDSAPRAPLMWRLIKWMARILVLLLVVLLALYLILNEGRPQGQAGPEAEALAARMEAAVKLEAWNKTGAVRWVFAGRNGHLWDRRRQLARVEWGATRALIDLNSGAGRAWVEGREASGEEQAGLLAKAKSHWINDSFWLNPVAKLRDDGVSRSLVSLEDGSGLLVTYGAGGKTPGDAYLWIVDDAGLPKAWKMWTKIIPIGGVGSSWEDWIDLKTGARVATRHKLGPLTVALTEVAGAATLAELEPGEDPFAPLFERASAAAAPASRPASRPAASAGNK